MAHASSPPVRKDQCDKRANRAPSIDQVSTAEKPIELVRAVVYAMIGHYNLYKAGWLHCDVSPTSIMIIRASSDEYFDSGQVDADFELESLKHTKGCRGIITETDAIRKLANCEEKVPPLPRIWNNYPFASTCLHEAAREAQPYRRTFLDDLESALWVMVSEYLRQVKLHQEANDYEYDYLRAMKSEDGYRIYCQKRTMAVIFSLRSRAGLDFAAFNEFFAEWLDAIDSCDRLELFARDAYQKVLGFGFRYLGKHPECWDLPWHEFFDLKRQHDWENTITERTRELLSGAIGKAGSIIEWDKELRRKVHEVIHQNDRT